MATSPEVTGKKTGRRLLDYQALRERGIPFTRIHIARLEAAGKFPLHIKIGDNAIAWFEDEIDDHLDVKAAERDTRAAKRDAEKAGAPSTECVPIDGTEKPSTGRKPPPPRPKRRRVP